MTLSRDEYFARWAELHGGYDPRTGSAWLRGWLTMVHAVAQPLARRGVSPDAVTYGSLVVSALAAGLAALGGRWLLLATLVLVVSGLLDNLDGAVAVLTGRTTRWGYVLDSVVDRLSDLLYLVALVAVGAPVELAALCGALVFLLEYSRARAGNAGGDEVGAVTIAERPTRVIVVAAALLAGGLLPGSADDLATAGVGVLAALTAAGLGQLLPALRRSLPD